MPIYRSRSRFCSRTPSSSGFVRRFRRFACSTPHPIHYPARIRTRKPCTLPTTPPSPDSDSDVRFAFWCLYTHAVCFLYVPYSRPPLSFLYDRSTFHSRPCPRPRPSGFSTGRQTAWRLFACRAMPSLRDQGAVNDTRVPGCRLPANVGLVKVLHGR